VTPTPVREVDVTTGITYGTFDLFHIGHLRIIERARSLCDQLVVGVSTDEFNAMKGKRTAVPYEDRAAIVRALRLVDEVIPERTWEQKSDDITRLGVDVFVMGDDWRGKFDHLKSLCDVVYLPRTPGISTTELRGQVVEMTRNGAFTTHVRR
jgi:glycerol-3-phosphate cytidylyltransferase